MIVLSQASTMKWLFLASCVALGCGQTSTEPKDAAPSPSCAVIDASTCQNPIPSYSRDVAPALDRTCNSTCHAPGVGPWPLTNYADVFDWGSIIGGDIAQCTMPPPDAGAGNGNLTDQERAAILNWLVCGAPNN
jgi:hypothetical protein